MKITYHAVTAKLLKETDLAVKMNIDHAECGLLLGVFVPKSVIADESMELVDESGDGDLVDIYIKAWWFRKNYGGQS